MNEAEVIEVQIPVDPAYLAVLRTAAAGLATRLRFTLSEIEDLRIAVDEAASMLIAGIPARPANTEMTCRFDVTDEDVTVSVSVPVTASGSGPLLGNDTIPWRVLNALTGTVSTRQSDEATTITLVKNRSGDAG